MELTDREIHLLAWLSRGRRLYAECNGADIDALQRLGLLQWFDARSSTTPFKQDLRLFLKLYGVSSRVDYAWVAAVNDWRERVGPEISAKVDAVDESEWGVNSGPLNGAGLLEQTRSGAINAGRFRRAVPNGRSVPLSEITSSIMAGKLRFSGAGTGSHPDCAGRSLS